MRKAWGLVPAFAAAALVGCGSGHPAGHEDSVRVVKATADPTPSAAASGPSSTAVLAPTLPAGSFVDGSYPVPVTGPLTSVGRRSAGSVALRAYKGTTPAPTCDPYTASCVPDWCEPSGQVVVELSTDAIAVREAGTIIGVAPKGAMSLLLATGEGSSEGAPVLVAAARTAAGVDHVVLKTASGSDTMSPVGGLVALAVAGPATSGTLTAYDATGQSLAELSVPDLPTQSQPVCASQPMRLPQPGKQPADPAAAEQQVRTAFVDAFTHDDPTADWYTGLRSVVNGAALKKAVDQVHQNFPEAANSISVTTGDLVFTNPTTAYVKFTPTYSGGAPYGEQNGSAVLVDGKWLVTESTFCGLMRFGGATCP